MASASGQEACNDIAVRVALRIRPLVKKEIKEGCQECLDVMYGDSQLSVRGTDKAFTFDYAFPSSTSQDTVYDKSVSKMVKELFKGYNVTILAYGQTGSGKTYSMGTTNIGINDSGTEWGIIPRAVQDIFTGISERTDDDIVVKVSFIELYKESLFDLLNRRTREDSGVEIREDHTGAIKITGLTEIPVTSVEETMQCLERGAVNRATGATAMNARSSRSHAIFSLHIEIGNKKQSDNIMSAKFHMVDLAGSERAKKTGATGERFKEGVNINKGLLALGNVISALCGDGAKGHVPYRDSKLTRLLQDSLGGNSHTLMLACVSPADSNLEETLSTLRYADRARKIKNKPIVNRDPQAAELSRLRQMVQQLQVQLIAANAGGGSSSLPDSTERMQLLNQVQLLQDENDKLTRALQTAIEENTNMAEKALMAEMSRDQLKMRLEELRAQTGTTVETLNKTLDVPSNPQFNEQVNLVKELQRKIIDMQTEQHKRERAIVDHELSRHSVKSNTGEGGTEGGVPDSNNGPDGETGGSSSPVKGEFGAAYTLRQAKINEELQDLNRALAMKEELMTQMTQNDSRFVVLKTSYERNMKEFEEQVNHLLIEKEELTQKLRSASHQNASSKIAEQRRKRLQELEGLISGLKKKIGEQDRLLKIKEQSEKKVTKLNSEIQGMKAVRVKLIRQMKEDSEKFRVWKAQKNREVAKLKEEDRKKQYQIVKMEQMHNKQQNVLKRKMEEAVSINKRLKDAMALQKTCREKRNASKDVANVASRMKCWLEGELEVVTVRNQAKKSLQALIEDRKQVSEQLSKVKLQLENGEFSPLLQGDLESKREHLEKDLQLRTAQISDMQMKVVEEDADSKKRFDSVQTMIEAKGAMQFLFKSACDNHCEAAQRESELKDINSQYEEVLQSLQETEAALKLLKEEQQTEISRISREHEEKVLFLLRQMPRSEGEVIEDEASNQNEDLMLRLKFQEEELSRLSNLHDLLQEKTRECEDIKNRLERMEAERDLEVKGVHRGRVSSVSSEESDVSPVVTPDLKLVKPTKNRLTKASFANIPQIVVESDDNEPVVSHSESDSDDSEDDEKKFDPDWRKTPLFKSIRRITNRGRKAPDESSEPSFEGNETYLGGVKRNSKGDVRCGCTMDCSSKKCKCKKNESVCCVTCKCNVLKCVNRSSFNISSSSDSSEGDKFLSSTLNVSSNGVAGPLSESSANKKRKISGQNERRTKENKEPHNNHALTDNHALTAKIEDYNFLMPPLKKF